MGQVLSLRPSRVSHHPCLQRAFNRSIHQLVAREKPVLRVVAVSAVLVDGDFPKPLPPDVLQPADWLNVAGVLSSEIEVFALKSRNIAAPALGEHVLVKPRDAFPA